MFDPQRWRRLLAALFAALVAVLLWWAWPVLVGWAELFFAWLGQNGTQVQNLGALVGLIATAIVVVAKLVKTFAARRGEGAAANSSAETKEQNDLGILLGNVRKHVGDRLNSPLFDKVEIVVGRAYTPEALAAPAERERMRRDEPPSPVPAEVSTRQNFDEAGRRLLILGEPGAGKSVEVLRLADALLDRAEAALAHPGPRSADGSGTGSGTGPPLDTAVSKPPTFNPGPVLVPVLLYLSAWAEKRLPLSQWIAAEVFKIYGITATVGADWLARGLLLPLLDGLDEVQDAAERVACTAAINAFCQDHGMVGLVVSCRDAEYDALPPLALQDAIRLLPLERAALEGYLDRAGPPLAGLKLALRRDEWLAARARTPLWLALMGRTFWGQSAERIIAATAATAGQSTGQDSGPARYAALWDAYLHRAFVHKRDLPWRGYTEPQTRKWLTRLAVEQERRGRTLFQIEDLQPDWGSRWVLALVGSASVVIFFLFAGFPIALTWLAAGMPWPVSVGRTWLWLYVGLFGLIFGTMLAFGEIEPAERVSWSWAKFRRDAPLVVPGSAFLTALIFGILGWSLDGSKLALSSAVLGTILALLAAPLMAGLATAVSDTRNAPNQGIRTSIRNGLRYGAVGVPLAIAVLWLTALVLPDDRVLGTWHGGLAELGLGFTGFVAGVWTTGGAPALQHYNLRLALRLQGRLPLHLARFCEHAVTLILLQRAGGGWLFIHPDLQKHLAARGATSDRAPSCGQKPNCKTPMIGHIDVPVR